MAKTEGQPELTTITALIRFAKDRGQPAHARQEGVCATYLWIVMELAYILRLRGIKIVTLTDANSSTAGVLTNRRKGSHGITDTKGTRHEKQEASGHRSSSMMDTYNLSVPLVLHPGEELSSNSQTQKRPLDRGRF